MPALDAVLFLAPRKSQVDVVQAVGRVMRRAEGKQMGYIILPVVISPEEDPEPGPGQQPDLSGGVECAARRYGATTTAWT